MDTLPYTQRSMVMSENNPPFNDINGGSIDISHMLKNNTDLRMKSSYDELFSILGNSTHLTIDNSLGEIPVDNFAFIVDGMILTLVSVFGVIGTIMSIIVLVKPRLRGTSRDFFSKFLTALAIYDTLFLSMAIMMFGMPALSFWLVKIINTL